MISGSETRSLTCRHSAARALYRRTQTPGRRPYRRRATAEAETLSRAPVPRDHMTSPRREGVCPGRLSQPRLLLRRAAGYPRVVQRELSGSHPRREVAPARIGSRGGRSEGMTADSCVREIGCKPADGNSKRYVSEKRSRRKKQLVAEYWRFAKIGFYVFIQRVGCLPRIHSCGLKNSRTAGSLFLGTGRTKLVRPLPVCHLLVFAQSPMSQFPNDAVSADQIITAAGYTDKAAGQRSTSGQAPHGTGTGSALRRFGYRLCLLYAFLFLLARVAGVRPGRRGIAGYYYEFRLQCVEWFGQRVLGLGEPIIHLPCASGDQVFDWVQVVMLLSVALFGALFWMFFDRTRRNERIAAEVVRIVIRYRLGITMLGYGMTKILGEQMPAPSIHRLLQPYGESSPVGLLWTFMGYSWAYSAFTGAAEFLGG